MVLDPAYLRDHIELVGLLPPMMGSDIHAVRICQPCLGTYFVVHSEEVTEVVCVVLKKQMSKICGQFR